MTVGVGRAVSPLTPSVHLRIVSHFCDSQSVHCVYGCHLSHLCVTYVEM